MHVLESRDRISFCEHLRLPTDLKQGKEMCGFLLLNNYPWGRKHGMKKSGGKETSLLTAAIVEAKIYENLTR